jgi:hypothetical protein
MYQSASGRPVRGRFSLLEMIYVEIFDGSKISRNFAKVLRSKTHTPKFSRNFRLDHRKFGENLESPSWIYDKVDFQSVSRRPGGPETQTNISINGGLRPPLIDLVVCVFSVGRRPATLEMYQSASSRPSRGGFSLSYRIYVEIFGGRKFRENFEVQNPHSESSAIFDPNPENFAKFCVSTQDL